MENLRKHKENLRRNMESYGKPMDNLILRHPDS